MGRSSKFSREEKNAAVNQVTEGEGTVLGVANEYGIHKNTSDGMKREYELNPEETFMGEVCWMKQTRRNVSRVI